LVEDRRKGDRGKTIFWHCARRVFGVLRLGAIPGGVHSHQSAGVSGYVKRADRGAVFGDRWNHPLDLRREVEAADRSRGYSKLILSFWTMECFLKCSSSAWGKSV